MTNQKSNTILLLVYTSLMTALVFITTFSIRIPVPFTTGYIHPGDTMVFLSGLLLGPLYGAFAAGVGSALSDLMAGYTFWVIPTLIIKGLMAYVVGMISLRLKLKIFTKKNQKNTLTIQIMLSFVIGGIIMIVGYYIAYGIIVGDFIVPIFSVPANIVQFVFGFIGAVLLSPIIIKLRKTLYN